MRPPPDSEPFRVSSRFRLTLEATILALEASAACDERTLAVIDNADHRRRQQRLVDAQLDRAFRLRELLGRTVCVSEISSTPVSL